jgi:AmiR/NasT family two-component response regulator
MIEHEAAVAVERLLAVTEASYERRAQLQAALDSRVVIEQAKGILAERHGLEVDEAFQILRRAARSNRLKVRDLASRVRPGCDTPAEIAELLDV